MRPARSKAAGCFARASSFPSSVATRTCLMTLMSWAGAKLHAEWHGFADTCAVDWGLRIDRLSVYKTSMSKRQAMQEPTFLILTALAAGPQHGYGIMTDVAQISGDRVRLRAGTLYAALDRLLGEGLVVVDRQEIVDGRLRRYYKLTPSGAELLAGEAARMQANARIAVGRLRTLAGGLT